MSDLIGFGMMKNGMMECSVCHSKLLSPSTKAISRAYDRHRSKVSSKQRALNVLLVVGDCVLVGLQVIYSFITRFTFVFGKLFLFSFFLCIFKGYRE